MMSTFNSSVTAITDACGWCDNVNQLMALWTGGSIVGVYREVLAGEIFGTSIAEDPVTAAAKHYMLSTFDDAATPITDACGRCNKVSQ